VGDYFHRIHHSTYTPLQIYLFQYFSIFDLELHHFIRVFINKNAIDEDDVVDKIKRILAVA